MSIPTRTKIIYDDGSTGVVSYGTVSYGSDTSNRDFWLSFFKERFKDREDFNNIVIFETMHTTPIFSFTVDEIRNLS